MQLLLEQKKKLLTVKAKIKSCWLCKSKNKIDKIENVVDSATFGVICLQMNSDLIDFWCFNATFNNISATFVYHGDQF